MKRKTASKLPLLAMLIPPLYIAVNLCSCCAPAKLSKMLSVMWKLFQFFHLTTLSVYLKKKRPFWIGPAPVSALRLIAVNLQRFSLGKNLSGSSDDLGSQKWCRESPKSTKKWHSWTRIIRNSSPITWKNRGEQYRLVVSKREAKGQSPFSSCHPIKCGVYYLHPITNSLIVITTTRDRFDNSQQMKTLRAVTSSNDR